jgi:hypothetical protein
MSPAEQSETNKGQTRCRQHQSKKKHVQVEIFVLHGKTNQEIESGLFCVHTTSLSADRQAEAHAVGSACRLLSIDPITPRVEAL